MDISRIAVFRESGLPLEIVETAIPELNSGEILIRNLYVTLCRSDINTYTGKRTEKTPTILGHEIIGIIEATGPYTWRFDERGLPLNEGDRVTWAIYSSDPDSPLAKKGMPQKANNLLKYGHEKITDKSTLHGGLGEFTILRKNTPVIKISNSVSNKFAATINCTVATVAGAIRLAGDLKGKTVGIFGAGMLGSIACAMSRVMGADRVTAFDIDNVRLLNAMRFGANDFVNINETNMHSLSFPNPDVILEFSGSPDSVEKSMEILAIGGIAIWIGSTFPQRDIGINAEKIIRNLHTIKGLHNYTNHDLIAAVDFVESHINEFPFDDLIEAEFTFDKVDEAFRYAVEKNSYRVGITFNKSK